MAALVWFRQDLRLADQPALAAAAEAGPVTALYVLDDEAPGEFRIGEAQRWWLHYSLTSLAADLAAKGIGLVLRRGAAAATVAQVAAEVGATSIHATPHYEPWWRAAEAELGDRLTLHAPDTLVPPERVRTGAGQPFKIFGPFYRAMSEQLPPPKPLAAPERMETTGTAASDKLEEWELLPTTPNWASCFADWHPGEAGAAVLLGAFQKKAPAYARRRDLPSEPGTSRLSPHLHFGEISPRAVWHGLAGIDSGKFLKELAWRDFARSALLVQPDLATHSTRMPQFVWRTDAAADADFIAWTMGRTGYPIVDAGMRQLWATGWMHNRVRMVTASFLVKHLLIDWRRGAAWFWNTLVDADLGSNSLNWQWIAGTGTDSAPFARIMAPLVQSSKFGAASYIRRWVPELSHLSDGDIHDPIDRRYYPKALISHREARERALAANALSRAC
ncbi:MAG: deoxyribodipyrimidine photo-lyase [Sphingomicrobium sp.]